MELSSALFDLNPPNFFLKKFLIFFPKKMHSEKIYYMYLKESFSYISINETLHFLSQARKKKKNSPWKKFLIFQETKTQNFIKRKLFLYLKKRWSRKNSLFFRKRKFLISQETLKKFPRTKSKKISYIFQKVTCKVW